MFSFAFLKVPKQVWALSGSVLLVMAGFSFLWPLTMIYVTDVLHRSVSAAGIILSAEAASGIIGSLIGGVLFDRLGGKKTIIFGLVMIVTCSFLLLGLEDWRGFIISFVTLTLFIGVVLTAISASAGLIWPEGGKKPFHLNYISQNVGVAVGTALGGIIAAFSFRMSFVIMAFIFITALLLTGLGLPISKVPHRTKKPDVAKKLHVIRFDRSLLTLLPLGLGSTFIMLGYIQWQTTVPVFMHDLAIPTSQYSFLWTLNGILVLALQPLNSFIHRRLAAPKWQFAFGVGMFLLAFVFLLFKGSYLLFVAGMVSLTLGEIVIWPSIPAITSQLAPANRKGSYQAIINIFNYGGRLLGPVVGTAMYQNWGAIPMLLIMILFQVIAFALFLISLSFFQAKSLQAHNHTLQEAAILKTLPD